MPPRRAKQEIKTSRRNRIKERIKQIAFANTSTLSHKRACLSSPIIPRRPECTSGRQIRPERYHGCIRLKKESIRREQTDNDTRTRKRNSYLDESVENENGSIKLWEVAIAQLD